MSQNTTPSIVSFVFVTGIGIAFLGISDSDRVCAFCQESAAPLVEESKSPRVADGKAGQEESDRLIGMLKSLEYQQRVEASRKLVGFGKIVIRPLFKAISSSDIETSFRAIKIIKEIGLNSDLDTLELIIIKTQDLPAAFRSQFNDWSSQAISKWKTNQSKIAVSRLAEKGATINEIDTLGELGFMLIEDLEERVKPLEKNPKSDTETVLEQIGNLKKELSGEVVTEKPRKQGGDDRSVQNIEISGRRLIVRGGELVAAPLDMSSNPRNVVFNSNWRGTPKDLNHLRFVSNLNQIEFVECKITGEILNELKKIRKLRSLLLTRCSFSFTELQAFKKEKDKYHQLQLMANGAGYLGVYGPNAGEPDNGNGSYVSLVSPNSAASEAGLERGDVIIRVDQDTIRSFADLSLVISSKPVGKEIKIAVRRDSKEKVVLAKLKSRVGLR